MYENPRQFMEYFIAQKYLIRSWCNKIDEPWTTEWPDPPAIDQIKKYVNEPDGRKTNKSFSDMESSERRKNHAKRKQKGQSSEGLQAISFQNDILNLAHQLKSLLV